jgi:UrcA family protein
MSEVRRTKLRKSSSGGARKAASCAHRRGVPSLEAGEDIMKTIIAFAAAVTLTGFAPQAVAQTDTGLRATVSYADLDLARADGRAVLERRVELAVARVCPARPLPVELSRQRAYLDCRTAAWSGARQQLAKVYTGHQLAQASVRVAAAGN